MLENLELDAKKPAHLSWLFRAGEGIRTPDFDLGKVALYH